MALTAPYRWKWDAKDNAGATTTFQLPKHNFAGSAGPAVTDDGPDGNYTPGSLWLDTVGRTLSVLIDGSNDAADWLQLGGYTDEAAQDAVGGILVDSSEIDFTYNDGTPSITASLVAASVALSKLASITQGRLLGNAGGSPASPAEITITNALDMVGSTRGGLAYRGASTWDLLAPGTTGYLLRSNGAGADPSYATLSAIIDALIGSTRGSILYRGASAWSALTPGTSGYQLTSQGAGADPIWGTASGSVAIGDLPALNGFTDSGQALLADELVGYDNSAGNRNWTIAQVGGTINPAIFEARLSTSSTDPFSETGGVTVLYLLPLAGTGLLGLYDGLGQVTIYTLGFGGITINTSGLSASTVYDVFVYDSGGLTLELVAWSSATARATGITATGPGAFYAKSGTTTKRYVGTIYTNASTQFSDSVTEPYVWNAHNRRHRSLAKSLSGSGGYNYSTAAWRATNNDTANRIGIVCGLDRSAFLELYSQTYVDSTAVATRYHGIDEDGTTTSDATYSAAGSKAEAEQLVAVLRKRPTLGFHYYQAMEYGGGSGTQTWYSQLIHGTWEG